MDENDIILQYFCQRIFKIFGLPNKSTGKLRRRWRVATTAVFYFRKFYAKQSLENFDPRLLMVTCIFLAGKVEEHYNHFVHLKELNGLCNPYSQQVVLSAEIQLIEGLDFQLGVTHPLNCMNTFIADWKRYLIEKLSAESEFDSHLVSSIATEWLGDAEYVLYDIQTTKAVVQFSPVSLAIAALLITESSQDEWRREFSLVHFLNVKFGPSFAEKVLLDISIIISLTESTQTDIDINKLCSHMHKIKNNCNW